MGGAARLRSFFSKQHMIRVDTIFNIYYDLPESDWEKIILIYGQMPGWLGFGADNLPYWFGYQEEDTEDDKDPQNKYLTASVEPAGLQFFGNLEEEEWLNWREEFQRIASHHLGYSIGPADEGYEFPPQPAKASFTDKIMRLFKNK